MKRTFSTLIAAGVMAVCGTAAYSQTRLEANIPFTFRVSGKNTLPPGKYWITREGSNKIMWKFAAESTKDVAVVTNGSPDGRSTSDKPALVFNCAAKDCVLSSVRPGLGASDYSVMPLPHKNAGLDEVAQVIVPIR